MKSNKILFVVLLAVGAFGIGACSGSDDGPVGPCADPFPACTGDPVGSWVLDTVCGYKPYDCADAVAKANVSQFDGTLTLNQDGSGSFDINMEMSFESKLPLSCISSCAEMDDIIGGCDESGDMCKCSGYSGLSHSRSFTWETSGGMAVLSAQQEVVGHVCVDGETAFVHNDDELFMMFRPAP